jgi:hypothetical protein
MDPARAAKDLEVVLHLHAEVHAREQDLQKLRVRAPIGGMLVQGLAVDEVGRFAQKG